MGSKSLYNQPCSIEEDAPWATQVMGQLQMQKTDDTFLKVFCFDSLGSTTDEESSEALKYPLNVIWAKEDGESGSIGSCLFEIRYYYYPFASELEGKNQQAMLQIDRSEKFKFSTNDEMLSFDRIKVVKTKMNEINIYNARYLPHAVGLMSTLLEQADINKASVGFDYEIVKIIGHEITKGDESLDIMSIIGMGGLGKSNLAY